MALNSVYFLLSTFLMTLTTVAGAPYSQNDYDEKEECQVNADCAKGFCYQDTHKCADCINCASHFRNNSSWKCPEQASECGECLPGYMEVDLERNAQKGSCMPIPDSSSQQNTRVPSSQTGPENIINTAIYFLIGFGTLSVLVATFVWNQRRRGRLPDQPQQAATELQELVQHPNQPPPPYSPFASKFPTSVADPTPTAPSLSQTLEVNSPRDCDTSVQIIPAVEDDRFVQAGFSRHPNWVNAGNCTGLLQSTPPPSEEFSDEGLDIQDDDTQPSDWTPPNTSQENVEEAGNHLMTFNTPPQNVGSTAVGTVDGTPHRTRDNQDLTRVRRRESVDDTQNLASSQESCEEAPREKRMRSESPSSQPHRNFHPDVFLSQTNNNVNNVALHTFQNPTILINLNVNRDDVRTDPEPTVNALMDSEDFRA